jgi:hypothetical protein
MQFAYGCLNQQMPTQMMPYMPNIGQGHLRSKFTKDEDVMLKQIVERDPTLNWNQIARMMPGRTARQVRERYKNYLSPRLNNGSWTEQEDEVLRQKFAEHGPRWAVLKNFFPGRTDVNVKNRWATLLSQDCRAEWKERSSPKEKSLDSESSQSSEATSPVEKITVEPIFPAETCEIFQDSRFDFDFQETFCSDCFHDDIWLQ